MAACPRRSETPTTTTTTDELVLQLLNEVRQLSTEVRELSQKLNDKPPEADAAGSAEKPAGKTNAEKFGKTHQTSLKFAAADPDAEEQFSGSKVYSSMTFLEAASRVSVRGKIFEEMIPTLNARSRKRFIAFCIRHDLL